MHLRCKMVCGLMVGTLVVMLILHWELDENANIHLKVPKLHSNELGQKNETLQHPQLTSHRQKGSGYFKKLAKNTYIYSAFYELQTTYQKPVIRLIILSGKHYQPKLLCHFCSSAEASCNCPAQPATYYTNNENHGRRYGGFIATCLVPHCFDNNSPFVYVSAEVKGEAGAQVRVVWLSTVASDVTSDYSVCTPPLRGQGNHFLYQLIEFIELTHILGAKHLTFYDFQIDGEVKKVLRYYEQRGLVSVLPWNLPGHMAVDVQQVWYYGQVLAIQDCLYRNKGHAKFVAFNDIDEFIVPLQHPTVPLLMHSIHSVEHSGHCFDSVLFSLNARIPRAPNKRSRLYSQRIFHRTTEKLSSWSKCIVDPRQIFEMGIHHISKAKNNQLVMKRVDEKYALLFHYRTCSAAYGVGKVCGHLIPDYTMQRFAERLQNNVNTALKQLH